MGNQPEIKLTDRIRFHMLLAAAGGVMDAYSYVDRGGVFATGQTGNFVLAAIRLLLKDYKGMGLAFVPIAAFWAGIFLARHFYYIYNREQVRWMSGVLLLAAAVLFLVGFIPHTLPHLFANTAVSFSAADSFVPSVILEELLPMRRFSAREICVPVRKCIMKALSDMTGKAGDGHTIIP